MGIPPPRGISSLHLGTPRAIVQIKRPRAQIARLISAQNSQRLMTIYWLQDATPVRPLLTDPGAQVKAKCAKPNISPKRIPVDAGMDVLRRHRAW